ncbi:MAG TPA: hypothetical protein DCL35_02655 [Candidatus Omnitrophica bacterium]|nr:hypothetical protein [Candidatus Omnitrophota bacterium]
MRLSISGAEPTIKKNLFGIIKWLRGKDIDTIELQTNAIALSDADTEFIKFLNRDLPGIRSLSLSVIQPRERAWKNKAIVPRYRDLDRQVSSALKIADEFALVVNNPYCGLPLCIGEWYNHLERCVEYCQNVLHKEKPLDQEKIKPARCSSCSLTAYCNGVWKEYAYIHPLDDLKPLQRIKS